MDSPKPAHPAPSLPVIDIGPCLRATAPDAVAATHAALRAALLTHGFFYLTGHGVDPAFLAAVLGDARAFFHNAPASEKRLLQRQNAGVGCGDGARGYQVVGENVTQGQRDWHEGWDAYRPRRAGEGIGAALLAADEAGVVWATAAADQINGAGAQHGGGSGSGSAKDAPVSSAAARARQPPYTLLGGVNLWPATPPSFRATLQSYVAQMHALGVVVLRAVGMALELRDPSVFAEGVRESCWVLRAIGYPPLPDDAAAQGGVSCGEHSDYGCLTLLLADATPGALQVRDRATGGWLDVPPMDGALVVNVGDMVELWTAGWVQSTKHRVVHRGQSYRVSVPFFLEPGEEVVIEPLPECVERMKEEGRTPLEGKVRFWDHLVGKVGGNFYELEKDEKVTVNGT